ncbi:MULTISPECIES: fimbrial protein [Providencia]|uniref:Fimbrial protein n=1 Tax=Providencia stuartii TaxID=588 RepID=A0AAI9DAQ1_PROST|nr:fimbrial protein [Providencia stuartii]ELR5040815.1 fimbrial protein [Providencia stuartii]ELR5083620.1 fimbrial protein [Providencia stuartii]ELR5112321.1 fimbrial protein [Providencia stuartii]MDV5226131.1 fimbrial protein [Providencia rettgeri]
MIHRNIKYSSFLLLLLLTFFSTRVFALDCVESGTGVVIKPPVPVGQLAIPADTPAGTIIWQSDPMTVTVFCDNVLGNMVDVVHMYFNPTSQKLGTGLLLGANYQGQQLERDKQKVSLGTPPISGKQNVTVVVNFTLYIKVTGVVPPSGHYDGDNQFTVFQFDGSGGINTTPGAKNLRYSISGLTGIRFLKCGADIKVYPESQQIDFGQLMITELNRGQEFTKQFQVQALKRGCLDNFSMNVNFETTDKLNGDYAIDLGNGTNLTIADDKNNLVKFNYFEFFGSLPKGSTSVTRTYNASIKKSSTVKTGSFNASTIVRINYY